MYNLGDDSELDRLSREAAGRYETPGNANWQALSEELDKVMPEEKKKRRFLFWWLLPALLAGGGITYGILRMEGNSTASTEKNTPAISTDKSTEQATQLKNDQTNKTAETATDQKTDASTATTATVAAPQTKEKVTASFNGANSGALISSSKKNTNKISLNNTKSKAGSTDQPEKVSTPVQQAMITPETTKTSEQTLVIKEQKEVTKETNQTEQAPPPITAAPAKTDKDPVAEESPVKEDLKKPDLKKILPARGKGWSIGLLTGIDKSTVKLKYGYAPGFNLGMELAYHFNDQWAVRTGGIFTQKNYKLAGEDFTAPKGTPISYYKLDQVEGSCHMWEVPLLVSYTVSSRGNKSVTLNTGLSSYFMTHEDYDYYYLYNGTPTYRSASYSSADQHIFSVVHLSAGFENRLGKTMSLQIEPYAKIPLGGVGFGNIQLSSFGVNLSVQYRQPHKK